MREWPGRIGVRRGPEVASSSVTRAFAGDGYGAVAGESAGGSGGSGGGGTLPFTGAGLALYGCVALLLIVSGLLLRGYDRRASDAARAADV